MAKGDRNDERPALTVPKFSSFKSKLPPGEPSEHKDSKQLKELDRREQPYDSRKRRRGDDDQSSGQQRPRHHRHQSRRERTRSRSREGRQRPDRPRQDRPRPDRPSTTPTAVAGLFVIDANGDPLITRYGGIDKSQMIAYHRHGGGRVLGTPGRLVIHRDQARDRFSLRMPGEGSAAFAENDGLRSRRPALRPNPVMIRPRKGDSLDRDEAEDFLALSSKKRSDTKPSDDSTDEDEPPSYRSIRAKAKLRSEESDSEEASDTSLDIAVTQESNPLRWKSMQLSRQVKESPHDIDAWIELVDHQDALLKAGEDIDHSVLEDEARSFAEIKVSMLERALPNTKNPHDRRRVLVRLMREGSKVWSGKVAEKKWAQVLQDEDDNFELWKAYFDFSVSNITTFRYDDVKRMLLDRLRRLLSRTGDGDAGDAGDAFGEALHVFLLATRFVHAAGFQELAVASWQGLLELNLFRPSKTSHDDSALQAFHDFWESEVPRLGEPDAKGWAHFVESGGGGVPPEPVTSTAAPEPLISKDQDAYKTWCLVEQSQAKKAVMPARTMDDGTQDDPFRVVMFADIEEFLFLIPDSLLPRLLEQMVDSFLIFSGFPPAFLSSSWTRAAMDDQSIFSFQGDLDLRGVKRSNAGDEAVRKAEPTFEHSNVRAAISPWLLFGDAAWFRYIPKDSEDSEDSEESDHLHPLVDPAWVSETLRQIVHTAGMESLAPYYLAVRFSLDPTTVKRTAKALLKRFPANAHVYNAYALAESANNEPAVANKVLLSTTEAPSLLTKWYRFLLHKSWSWIELQSGDKIIATIRLCASADPALRRTRPETPELGSMSMSILKARQAFTSEFDELLADRDLDGAGTLAECLILLSYLTAEGGAEPMSESQGNIATAMSVAEAISRDFAAQGLTSCAAHETVLQFAAQLLYFNASRGPFRRAYMRERLCPLIALFPQNTVLLSLYEYSDASLRVIDETRALLHETVLTKAHDCPSSRVFAIRHELRHGNANTVRSAFEQALASDACRNSPALWIAYIRFCGAHGTLRHGARDLDLDVFYRALRHCPASRGVAMEAFGTLGAKLGGEELRGVFEQMSRKGLRIHVDLEEYLGSLM